MESRLWQVFLLAARMGVAAFGGPVAHLAMMEREVIEKRGWIERDHFMDLLAITNLVPGPNSTQMIMHFGFVRGGDPGTWIAGLGFILPAFLITLALSWFYVHLGMLPAVEAIFYGIKPAIVALIVTALWRMSRKEIRGAESAVLFSLAVFASFLGVNELLVMAGGAFWGLARHLRGRILSVVPTGILMLGATSTAPGGSTLTSLGLLFLRFGATLYGSGYLLIAFIQRDLVSRMGWLTGQQLLDAIAIGQMTPGPILTTSTVVGYIVSGVPGAIVATTAIFLPSFFFVMMVGRWMDRLRDSRLARSTIDAILPTILGVIAVVAWGLGREALVDPFSVALAIGAGIALMKARMDSVLVIILASGVGYVWQVLL